MTCQEPGCDKPALNHGWCRPHGNEVTNDGDLASLLIEGICSSEGCPERSFARQLCKRHYGLEKARLSRRRKGIKVKQVSMCKESGCPREVASMGWCRMHHRRWQTTGDPSKVLKYEPPRKLKRCAVKGCKRVFYGRGWCRMHYERWYNHGDPLVVLPTPNNLPKRVRASCLVESCSLPARARDLCSAHYQRWYLYGQTFPDKPIRGRGNVCAADNCFRMGSGKSGLCPAHQAKARRASGIEPPQHGSSGYTNYSCRCSICVDAQREAYRRYWDGRRYA